MHYSKPYLGPSASWIACSCATDTRMLDDLVRTHSCLMTWYEVMQKTGAPLSWSQLQEVTCMNVQYREIYERSSLFLPKDSVPWYKENSVLLGRSPGQFGGSWNNQKKQAWFLTVFTLGVLSNILFLIFLLLCF